MLVIVKKKFIKKNSLLVVDGYPMRLRGASGDNLLFKNNVQLVLTQKYSDIIHKIEKYLEYNQKYEVAENYEGFNHEDLNDLYEELYKKLKYTIYEKRPSKQANALEKGRELFFNIEKLSEKARLINEILTLLRCDEKTTADLRQIGGGSSAGSISIKKNTVGKQKLVLVHQSVTGLFETKEELA